MYLVRNEKRKRLKIQLRMDTDFKKDVFTPCVVMKDFGSKFIVISKQVS